jgi:heme/copper-type cytochrome/quinol oxidase subunit 2
MEDRLISFYGNNRFNASDYIDNDTIPVDGGVHIFIYIMIAAITILIFVIVFCIYKCKRNSAINRTNNVGGNNVYEPMINNNL